MAHSISSTPANVTERDFMEFVQRGDDFFNIELLRPAKSWYTKALRFNMETETIQKKIEACDRLLAYERRIVNILSIIASVIILLYLLFLR